MKTTLDRLFQVVLFAVFATRLAWADDDTVLLPDNTPMLSPNYNWNLPSQPGRPSQPLPRFQQDTILPDRIQFNTIPKANMLPENLRPRDIQQPPLLPDALVRDSDIMPQHLLDTPLAPPRQSEARPETIDRPYDSSMIFLPQLPPPTIVPQARPEFQGDDPVPNHRHLLGW